MHMPEENKEEGTAQDAVSNDEKAVWFAMSAPYRRELRAKQFLEERDIECFVPMRYAIVEKGSGIKQRKMVPAIHNLIFVHTTKERIKRLKQGVDFLQYRTKPVNGKNVPIIVPDRQMNQFIAATKEFNEDIIYLQPDEIDKKRMEIVRRTYENAMVRGDKNAYFIPGPMLMRYAKENGTVDGCHPTDYGFASMARVLIPLIKNPFRNIRKKSAL